MSAQPAKPTAQPKPVAATPRKITLEDVRRRAERVQQTAKDDAMHTVREVASLDTTRMILFAVAGVVVVAGVAYYMGTRAAKSGPPAPSS